MRKVNFIFLVIVMLSILINSCLATEPTVDKKGKWGISLSVSGLDDLGIGLYQGGIGIKHLFSNSIVLKTILGVGGSSKQYYSQSSDYTDRKINQGSFSLDLGTEFHFGDSKFSPYVYTGFNYTTTTRTEYYSIPVTNPAGWTKKQHNSTSSFGLDGAIGLEYFFSKRFSLAGEYQVGLSFQTDKMQLTRVPGPGVTQPPEQKTTTTTLGTKTSSLILTVYF